jgi:hypothetical protein
MFYGVQITHIDGQTIEETIRWMVDPQYWIKTELRDDLEKIHRRLLDDELQGWPEARRRTEGIQTPEQLDTYLIRNASKRYPVGVKVFSGQGQVEAYLVVKPTLVEYYLSKFDPSGIGGKFPRGARVHAFPVLSDANRDALARVVAELSLSYEEHEEAYQSGRPYERYYDLRFGEPGWFDVTREESG